MIHRNSKLVEKRLAPASPLSVREATRRIRRRACNFPYREGWRNQARETGSTTSSSAHPSASATFTPRSASPRGSRRASSDAQRILHKLRALTTDNRAIPAAARNLLFFFLRPSVLLSHLPPFSTLSLRRRRRRRHRPPPALFHLDFPFFAFRLVRQGASSGTRGRHVSARVGVACTRRYASSSTFVTSPASRPPSSL